MAGQTVAKLAVGISGETAQLDNALAHAKGSLAKFDSLTSRSGIVTLRAKDASLGITLAKAKSDIADYTEAALMFAILKSKTAFARTKGKKANDLSPVERDIAKLASLGANLGAHLTGKSNALVRWPAALGGAIGGKYGAIGGFAGSLVGAAFGKTLSLALSGLGGVFKLAFKGVAAGLSVVLKGITGTVKLAVKGISKAFGAAFGVAKAVFSGIANVAKKSSLAVFSFFRRSLGLLVNFLSSWLGPFELIFTTIYELAASAVSKVVEFFADVPSKLGKLFVGQVETASEILSEIAKPLTSAFSNAASSIGKEIGKAIEDIGGFAEPILSVFEPVFKELANAVKEASEALNKLLKPALTFVVELGQGLAFALRDGAEAAIAAFHRMYDGAGVLGNRIQELIARWLELKGEWPKGGEIAIRALKKIGEGIGYVIDGFRAAPSYVAEATGQILESFAPRMLRMFAENIEKSKEFWRSVFVGAGSATDAMIAFCTSSVKELKRVVDMIVGPLQLALKGAGYVLIPLTAMLLQNAKDEAALLNAGGGKGEKPAKKFAEVFGEFFDTHIAPKADEAAANLRGAADAVGPIAQQLKDWGKAHRVEIGETAVKIGAYFDDMLKRFQKNAFGPKKKKPKGTKGKNGKPSAAVERGSREAFKIIAGVQQDKMFGVANQQLDRLNKIVELMKRPARRDKIRKGKL